MRRIDPVLCVARMMLCLVASGSLVECGSFLAGPSGGGKPNPVPQIASLNPSSTIAGSQGFTLTVTGTNFTSDSLVLWNGNVRSTTFVSSAALQASIAASDIGSPGSEMVTVSTPGPGGGSSAALAFTINPAPPGVTQTISLGANDATANGNSHAPALNANGRFVAFVSEATNLITPSTNFAEAYVRDTCLSAHGCMPSTQIVSAASGGQIEGNSLGGASPSISADGRFISFLSTATNLVTPNTSIQQGYLRDTCSGMSSCTPLTVLASVAQNGVEPNGAASDLMLSSNSCNAAFTSTGTNVVSGVTTPNEVYLSSCSSNGPSGGFTTSSLVSADSLGVPGNQGGQQPAISADGRFVVFASSSTNLPRAPGGGLQQIYLRDACTGASNGCAPSTTLVSVDNSGNPLIGTNQFPAVSHDGRFAAFSTEVPLSGGGITSLVYLRDNCVSSGGPVTNCSPSTITISVAADGSAANGPSDSRRHAVSSDGRFVVFSSSATNLIAGGNPAAQVFVRDTCQSSNGKVSGCTPRTVLISVDSAGNPIGGFDAAISDDGHYAAFENEATIIQILFAATGF